MGQSVAPAGDIDGDGFNDIVVGGLRAGDLWDDGRAVVFSGSTHQQLRCFKGPRRSSYDDYTDKFGWAVAGGGDADGDGVPDIAIGSRIYPTQGPTYDSSQYGRVYLFSGRTGDTIHLFDGEWGSSEFGYCLAFAGDVNGDGHDDLLVGAPERGRRGYRYGAMYMFSGLDGSLVYKITGDVQFGQFGASVAILGDLDDDSVNDFIVGSDNRSHASVFSGRSGVELYRLTGQNSGDWFGISVAALGDLDGDGYSDLAVGAPSACCDFTGWVYVYSGKTGEELRRIQAERALDLFGYSVASAGDVDLDGTPDMLVGAPYADIGSQLHVGKSYVFSGRTGSLMHVFTSNSALDLLGIAAAFLGDIDGDGRGEVAACAVGYDGVIPGCCWGEDIGRVYVYSFCDVEADVLPGQCPNIIPEVDRDLRVIRPSAAAAVSASRLTAAFVGSGTLDVSTIDPTTVLLEGVAPVSVQVRDVTAPSWIKESPCDCAVRGADGYPDLVAQFDLKAVRAAMTMESILRPSDVVNLTAILNTGEPIIGRDCLRIDPMPGMLAGVAESDAAVAAIKLTNAPNPFNAATTISYVLTGPSPVKLAVFDVLGRHVTTLVGAMQEPGEHHISWDGRNDSGTHVASGVYFYRLDIGSFSRTKQMIFLK